MINVQVQRYSESSQEIDRTSKPPHHIRTVPILRQSVSDSGVGEQISRLRTASCQDEKSENCLNKEILQREHERIEVHAHFYNLLLPSNWPLV